MRYWSPLILHIREKSIRTNVYSNYYSKTKGYHLDQMKESKLILLIIHLKELKVQK